MRLLGRFLAVSVLLAAIVLPAGQAMAATPSPPFAQCPGIGADASCAILLDLQPGGSFLVLADGTQGPYDGSDDTLVGVVNDSGAAVSKVTLSSSSQPIFGFEGDGICSGFTFTPASAGTYCGSLPGASSGVTTQDPGDYQGPDNTFSNISGDTMSGEVDFTTPLAPGATTFFSLEENLAPSDIIASLVASKTADSSTIAPGGSDGYTITIANPNTVSETVSTVVDTLPSGFTYVAGSTTGGITADPTISGSTLTWTGTFAVAASSQLTFHFGVKGSSTPGTYTNSVSGTAVSDTVVPATMVAPVTVGSVVVAPALPWESLPIAALTLLVALGLGWSFRRRLWPSDS